MDDIVQALNTSLAWDSQAVYELRRRLSKIAELLGTEVCQLNIGDYVRQEYMRTSHRDRLIRSEGPVEGMPPIRDNRSQEKGARPGIGIFLYQSSGEPNLKYVIYSAYGTDGGQVDYLIMRREHVFTYARCCSRLNKLANMPKDAPILKEGLLEEIVQNTIGFLLRAREIKKYGVKIKRGIILDGPPGNGKSMLCRYIQNLCTQHNIDYGVVTGSDIESAYASKSIGELFQMYTVSFFDDIDISYMNRNKVACSILSAMDGVEESYENEHLIRIFTTNEPISGLDPAFTRPGRIDKCITIERPTLKMRRKLIDTWPQEILDNIDVTSAAERSTNYSFAELEAIRTFLVTNKIIGEVGWDLNKAFEDFESRSVDKKPAKVGFGSSKT
jgi:cell division protease FtsH